MCQGRGFTFATPCVEAVQERKLDESKIVNEVIELVGKSPVEADRVFISRGAGEVVIANNHPSGVRRWLMTLNSAMKRLVLLWLEGHTH